MGSYAISVVVPVQTNRLVRESSFNMTRWGGGGDEDIEGGLRKFLDTRKGGL